MKSNPKIEICDGQAAPDDFAMALHQLRELPLESFEHLDISAYHCDSISASSKWTEANLGDDVVGPCDRSSCCDPQPQVIVLVVH